MGFDQSGAFGNLYAPVGSYNAKRRLNTGLNLWALEPNVAVTWMHPKYGQEVSLSMGCTMNFQNPATYYTTGNEIHLEYFLGQQLPKGFALGLAGYIYQQVTAERFRSFPGRFPRPNHRPGNVPHFHQQNRRSCH